MEKFADSVEIMLFVYALAIVVSYAMAGIISLIFQGIRMKNTATETTGDGPEGDS